MWNSFQMVGISYKETKHINETSKLIWKKCTNLALNMTCKINTMKGNICIYNKLIKKIKNVNQLSARLIKSYPLSDE